MKQVLIYENSDLNILNYYVGVLVLSQNTDQSIYLLIIPKTLVSRWQLTVIICKIVRDTITIHNLFFFLFSRSRNLVGYSVCWSTLFYYLTIATFLLLDSGIWVLVIIESIILQGFNTRVFGSFLLILSECINMSFFYILIYWY